MLANFEICEEVKIWVEELENIKIDKYDLYNFLLDKVLERANDLRVSKNRNKFERIFEECLDGVEIEKNYHGFGITSDNVDLNEQTIKKIKNNLKLIAKKRILKKGIKRNEF